MAICGIYKITNDVNGHAYIGQAVDVFVRWRQHFNEAYNPESNAYDGYFYRAVRKYGVENFSMKVHEVCKSEELNDREIFYIKKFETFSGFLAFPGEICYHFFQTMFFSEASAG